MNISDIIIEFLMEEPFIGYILTQLDIKENNDIETAAVYFDNQNLKYVLIYNLKFMEKLSQKEKLAIIKHEIYHIVFKHLIRYDTSKFSNLEIANISMDISINQYIDNLPKGALYPEEYNLPKNLNWEEYYILLNNNNNNNNNNSDNNNNSKILDKHIFNEQNFSKNEEENENLNKEIQDIYTKNLLEEAYNEELKKEKEFIKSFNNKIKKQIEDILNVKKEEKKINIKKIFKNFIEKELLSNKKYTTWFRPNRRFKDIKGTKKEKRKKILIAIDTSYSIDEEIINKFINEIYYYFDNLIDYVEIVLFTNEIYTIIKDLNKKNKNLLKNIQRGGTDFQIVLDYAMKQDFNYILMLTDGLGNYKLKLYNKSIIFINEKLDRYLIVKNKKEIESFNLFQIT